ncbi:MAG: site-specific integrase [Desulfobulbaceae bacterium]|nr:site-specific integrase [Desulfobulbaceae bacterium]
MAKAVRYGLLVYNPTQGASLPRYSHKKMTALDASQALQFILTAKMSRYYALFYLAVKTGMRIGELLGLEWTDILWSEGAIHIQQQKQDVPGKGSVFIEPKTNAGRRTIRIGEETLSLLRRQKEEQCLQRTFIGARWRDMNLVFPNSIGGPGVSSNIRKEFNKVLDLAGLPRIRFHDLRHTAASILLNNNIPVNVVSGILGHSKPSVTLDIYAHVFHDQQEEAATLMDKLLTPIPIEILASVEKPPINH